MANILVVDDEAPLRHLLLDVLGRAGHHVLQAPDGRAGLQAFAESRPDLVITDLIMPEMEGIELISAIKKIDPGVKIIAMSGGGRVNPDLYLTLAAKFGAAKVMSKPVGNKEMLAAVDEVLSMP